MARKLFQLVGQVALDGAVGVNKQLTAIDRKAAKASKEFVKLGKRISAVGLSLTKNLTVPIAAAGLAVYKFTELASDLAEETSKVGELFGSSATEIEEWSKTAATAFGQSRTQAMSAAANFAIFGKSAGLAGKKLVKFTTGFTELASDLASFNNTSPEEAIVAIGAAMRGEAEPIRRYGVLLNDATLKQKALEMGIISSIKGALTPQQKVLASSAVIMDQTASAQGDFARTSGQLANQQRILKAEITDMATELGTVFLPIALKVVSVFRDKFMPVLQKMVKWFKGLDEDTVKWGIALSGVLFVLGPMVLVVGKLVIGIRALTTNVMLLNSAFLANPFVLAAAGIVAIAVAIDRTGKAWKKWSDDLEENIAQKQTNALKNNLEAIIPLYGELVAMSSRGILNKEDAERFALLSEEVKNAETNIADLGTALEGGLVARMNQAENQLTDMNEELALASESTDEYTESTEAATVATKDLTAEEKKRAEALRKTREAEAQANLDYFHSLDEQIKDAKAKDKEQLAKQKEEQQAYYDGVIRLALEAQADKLDLLHLEEDDAMAAAEKMLAGTEKLESAKQAIRETYAKKREDLESQTQNKITNVQAAGVQMEKFLSDERVQATIAAVGMVSEIFAMANEVKMNDLENSANKEKQAVERSTMNEEEKAEAIKKIDIRLDKEKKKLQREQAKRDKAAAIFGAIVSTAQGIANALTLAFPLNLIMAALTGVLGAVQIAAIASQPLPFAEGGFIKSGRGGVQGLVGEGKEDEIIFPLKTGVMHLADALVGKLAEISNVRPGAALAVAGGGGGRVTHETHLHIGTFIGDKAGLKELERQLIPIRVAEEQRKGDER